MRLRAAAEIVPLHDALESQTAGDAGDVDLLAFFENVDFQLERRLPVRIVEMNRRAVQRVGPTFALAKMTGKRLVNQFGADVPPNPTW